MSVLCRRMVTPGHRFQRSALRKPLPGLLLTLRSMWVFLASPAFAWGQGELPSPLPSPHDPANAVAGFDIVPDVEVTLAASEPQIASLTNLDIDDRGRVWVCEVMNYRGHEGTRPEGDRILILEDTTGDGVMDRGTTFYQGNDINGAMGICVLDGEVLVSASPFIWRLIDDDGDDVADRKEPLFTHTGQRQHDHSAHSFVFGPDGKLYWNFGDTGRQVKDAAGNLVIDIHGRPVVDHGEPFYGGMVFRCNLDGSQFEVVGHNFRNSYEAAVDSFGSIWQSDNDDDGHRATRINFVMEQGNHGYRDEISGGHWRGERLNREAEIPQQHWHQNDPGVVPNVLITGAGSPAGLCVYEGELLPERFHNQLIHCDAGPGVVRAYRTAAAGAGYSGEILPLVSNDQAPWFRPVDVCTAPDGSLFFTDWYDSGVGGHRQEDLQRGRLYRIAPPGSRYVIPKFDYSTAAGAAAALRNPAHSVRYKAWRALHAMGLQAETALQELYRDSNPRVRARALWLLGKLPGRGKHYVRLGLADADENLRITAIRLLRQLHLVPSQVLEPVAKDPSAAVRREALIALRFDTSDPMPALWARLAAQHDGRDRWYLEALGIAADRRAEECFAAWLRIADTAAPEVAMEIAWRVRAPQAAAQIAQQIADPATELRQLDRCFRSLEFHPAEVRDQVLISAFLHPQFANSAADEQQQARIDTVIVRSLERVTTGAHTELPGIRQAIARHIDRQGPTAEFLRLVERFQPAEATQRLLPMAVGELDDSLAVAALRLVTAQSEGRQSIETALAAADDAQRRRLAKRLGLLGDAAALQVLVHVASEPSTEPELRSEAVRGLAASALGAKRLLALAQSQRLAADVRLLAGGLLSKSGDEAVRRTAASVLPRPATADARPLPPLDELAAARGDAQRGQVLFHTQATCGNCHRVAGAGKAVGPDLSEIGDKLSREAMLTSILDPSAAISHHYETHHALLSSGQVVSGVLVSQTDDSVTLRTAAAIDRTLAREELEELRKSEVSLMPEGLHQLVDAPELIDLVEYLLTLRKGG